MEHQTNLPQTNERLPAGVYEHYKGNRYRVLAVAKHSETLEEMVIYQALYGEGQWYVRPLVLFVQEVTVDGRSRPRFRLVAER